MKKFTIQLVLGSMLLALPALASAQCKSFTKRHCLSELAGFNSNGQYNGAVMFEGEAATMMQTFYSGKDYRLYVCSHDAIKDSLYFEVSDFKKNVIYSSKEQGSPLFDFTVQTTQQLYIKVVVPEMGISNDLKKNGCVSILVGFKDN